MPVSDEPEPAAILSRRALVTATRQSKGACLQYHRELALTPRG